MTNVQRDELLIQIVKEIGSFKEETKDNFLRLDKKIEDTKVEFTGKLAETEERLNNKIEDTKAELKNEFNSKIAETEDRLNTKIEETEDRLKTQMGQNARDVIEIFKNTWDRENKRNKEIDNKIIDINKKLKAK